MFFNGENGCLNPYFSRDEGFSQEHNVYSVFFQDKVSLYRGTFSQRGQKKIYLSLQRISSEAIFQDTCLPAVFHV